MLGTWKQKHWKLWMDCSLSHSQQHLQHQISSFHLFDLSHQNSDSSHLLHLIKTVHKYPHKPFTHCLVSSMITAHCNRLQTCGSSVFYWTTCLLLHRHSSLHLLIENAQIFYWAKFAYLLACWFPFNKPPQWSHVSSSVCTWQKTRPWVMEDGATANPSSDPFEELVAALRQALHPPASESTLSLNGVASPMAQPEIPGIPGCVQ